MLTERDSCLVHLLCYAPLHSNKKVLQKLELRRRFSSQLGTFLLIVAGGSLCEELYSA